jgi:hypothetical protein
MTWSDYIDESYNPRTFCVGGLLAPVRMWTAIETSWKQRIDYENRWSVKHGFPPISRYHATYCANLKREFSPKNGWDIPRQIRFSKRLCGIIGSNGPCGIVHGGGISDIQKHLPRDATTAKELLYHTSIMLHLMTVSRVMNKRYPDDKVTIYYDRTKDFGHVARNAFDSFMKDPAAKHLSKCFITMAPMGWEDCIPLQPVDLFAYEGMKRVDGSLQGSDQIRKALTALLGNDRMPVLIEHFTDQKFADLVRIIENKQDGKPLNDGVKSKLTICHNQ